MAHGATLVTQDVDICCPLSARHLLALQAAIADLHPVHRLTPSKTPLQLTDASCRGLANLHLQTDWGILDCLSHVQGVGGFRAVKHRSLQLDLGFGQCRVLDLDTLIIAKEAMGRARDRQAILQLRAIRARQQPPQ